MDGALASANLGLLSLGKLEVAHMQTGGHTHVEVAHFGGAAKERETKNE